MKTSPSRIRASQRLHVVGGSGTGKTSFAIELARRKGAPLHHLDEIERDPVSGLERPLEQRIKMVRAIATQRSWVTEGIQLGWSSELFERADVIIWADTVSWPGAIVRIARRFLQLGLSTLSGQADSFGHTVRRGGRARHLKDLLAAIGQTRRYYGHPTGPGRGNPGRLPTIHSGYAETRHVLDRYRHKVIHCRTIADLDRLLP